MSTLWIYRPIRMWVCACKDGKMSKITERIEKMLRGKSLSFEEVKTIMGIIAICINTEDIDRLLINSLLNNRRRVHNYDEKDNNMTDTAEIYKNKHCKDCRWPIIFACCNGTFREYRDAAKWDWWVYCSNKGCINHWGEGLFQGLPNWIGEE